MRAEAIGPRTWLAATLAGWALLAWLLALLGMGGRVLPLADDPALQPALPAPVAATPDRLGPASRYTAIAEQSVFAADRRPHPFFIEGQGGNAAAADTFEFVLTSVLMTPQVKLAILQPPDRPDAAVRVALGAALAPAPGWRLVDLQPRSAVFEGPQGRRALDLRVFDGKSGLPPTASSGQSNAPTTPSLGSPPPPTPPPASADAPASSGATAGSGTPAPAKELSSQEQMRLIRERIQARREQLRQQQEQNAQGTGAQSKP